MAEKLIQGQDGMWEVVIGLEVHAQITANAKLFSGASAAFGSEPNTHVSFVDAALPGMLPVINEHCVMQAIRTGLGLNAEINLQSVFDRKNYFYADLPQGYQISQFYQPIVGQGHLEIQLSDQPAKRIGITRLHLEQDAGKSIHDQHPSKSLIDLNRSGVALMEIVSDPDMRCAEEAQAYIKKLRSLLRYLGTCDGNMEQGNMRADVNISLRRPNAPFGTRAEIKNVNSIRFMGQAIQYEISRQMKILENGGTIVQETRLYDAVKGETRSMRSKEDAHDYRYFPDPDLPPLIISQQTVDQIKSQLPELPDQKKTRYQHDYQLTAYNADVLSNDLDTASYFETALTQTTSDVNVTAKLLANWIIGELFAMLNKTNSTVDQSRISAIHLMQLVELIAQDEISGKIAKDVFALMWEQKTDPATIIEQHGMAQISDDDSILTAINMVLAQNQDKVAEYRSGKDKLFGFFVGQVMRQTQGKASPTRLNDILKKQLAG